MKSELKPCPFCGSEARLTYSTDNHRQPYVTCDTPKCPGCNPYQWHYHTEAEAIEAWNRRAEPERKKGKWIGDCCSCCGVSKYNYIKMVDDECGPFGTWNFCPNCGAEMTRGEDGKA